MGWQSIDEVIDVVEKRREAITSRPAPYVEAGVIERPRSNARGPQSGRAVPPTLRRPSPPKPQVGAFECPEPGCAGRRFRTVDNLATHREWVHVKPDRETDIRERIRASIKIEKAKR